MPPAVPVTRGSIWWCDFSPVVGREQDGRRTALVLSNDGLNQGRSGLVVVAIMTGQEPKVPSHVAAPAAVTGCPRDATVMCEHIRTISINRLDANPIGRVDAAIMAEVEARIKRLLGL